MAAAFQFTGATVNIAVGAASARVALPSPADAVRVMNNGTATAWIAFGDNTVAATLAGSIPVGPGVTEVWSLPSGTTNIAAIAAGATGSIYFTQGAGL